MAEKSDLRDAVLSWIKEVIADSDQRTRLSRAIRSFLDDGRAAFVLTSGFILATAVSFRAMAGHINNYLLRINENTNELLSARHEPRRGDQEFGVLGALLARNTIQSKSSWAEMCGTRDKWPKDCGWFEKFLERSHGLWQKRWDLPSDNLARETSETGEALENDDGKLTAFLTAYQERCVDESADAAKAAGCSDDMKNQWKSLVAPFRCQERSRSVTADESSSLGCDRFDVKRSRKSGLFVMAQNDQSGGVTPEYSPRVKGEMVDALLFERALVRTMPGEREACNFDVEGAQSETRLVSLFFIGTDDVVRLWTCGQPSDPSRRAFSPTRRWASAHYFEKLQEEPALSSYASPPYIDYAGMGIVRTFCEPLRDGRKRLRAVVCGDFSVPLETLKTDLAGSELVDHYFVRAQVPFRDTDLWVSETFPPPSDVNHGDLRLRRQIGTRLLREAEENHLYTTGVFEEIGRKIIPIVVDDEAELLPAKTLDEPQHGQAAAEGFPRSTLRTERTQVVPSKGAEPMWLVPIGRHGAQLDAILLRARRGPQESIAGWVVATFVFALASGLLMSTLLRRTQRHAIRGRIQTILRNLQTGVVQIDEDENIVEANDRAEELLGVRLPRFGDESGAEQSCPFPDLIDPSIVEPAPGGGYSVAFYRHAIPPKRRNGTPSAYYVQLASGSRRGEWLRILGSPMFFANASGSAMTRYPRTYGVIEPVRDPELPLITRAHALAVSPLVAVSESSEHELSPLNDLGQRVLKELVPESPRAGRGAANCLQEIIYPEVVLVRDLPQAPSAVLRGDERPRRIKLTKLSEDALKAPFYARSRQRVRSRGADHLRNVWLHVEILQSQEEVRNLSPFIASGRRPLVIKRVGDANPELAAELESGAGELLEALYP